MSARPAFDDDDVADLVGDRSASRGLAYLNDGRVLEAAWDGDAAVVHGLVDGTAPRPYAVTVVLAPSGATGRTGPFLASRCTCPMQVACKHVAAVLLAVVEQQAVQSLVTSLDPVVDAPRPWATALAAAARPEAGPALLDDARTLGLQLRVTTARPPSRFAVAAERPGLDARVVVLGRKGRWTQGGVTWSNLGYSHALGTPVQRASLRNLAALHAADFPYARDAWLHLDRITPTLLWQALEHVCASGVAVVLDGRAQSPVRLLAEPVAVSLDIRRTPAGLEVGVPVRVDDAPVDPARVGFLGRPALGLFAWDVDPQRDEPVDLVLGRLAEPIDEALADLAGRAPVVVPLDEVDDFTRDLLPGLVARRTVRSSDGSFVLPDPPVPVLEARVSHVGTARLEVGWAWRYATPGSDPARGTRVPLVAGPRDNPAIRRDAAAEAEILADVAWLMGDYPHLAVPTASGHRLASIGLLAGLPMLRFVQDALPRLRQVPRVLVVTEGDPLDYREAVDAPTIALEATPRESNRDWLDLDVSVRVDGQQVPLDDLLRALTAGDEVLVLAGGTYLVLDRPELRQLRALVEEARSLQESPRAPLGVSRYHVDLWAQLEELGVVDEQAQAWRAALAALADDVRPRAVPATVQATLRSYQEEGFAWLARLRASGLGGVLADDMGLGKTLQAIALIADERPPRGGGRRRRPAPPWLVVAPASVVHNWAAEVARFAPSLQVCTIGETSARRGSALDAVVAGADVVVVSYTLFRLDIDEFCPQAWAGLILDEAQFVKNHQSKAYSAARQLDAPVKFAITGTPLENSLMELWAILSITSPGLFPHPRLFADYFQRPIEREADPDRLALLRRRIRPFLLRRTKEDVAADLPPKQEQVLELDLHPRHRKIYDTRLQRERQKVLGLLGDLDANRFQVFQALTMLRQLSLDASLVDEAYAGVPSAKLDALLEMLADVVAERHRVLVFSQFTRLLALAKARLDTAGIRYAYLDGRTRNRAAAIASFRDGDVPVFLISLKAGGFGLNLTEADYVVLLDPWWNPATEAQAVDRAHRIGQDRQVMVYRLVSRDTIEEKVMALKAEKAALFAGVLSGAGTVGAGLSADDIRELLS